MSKFEKYQKFVSVIGWSLFIVCFLVVAISISFYKYKQSKYWRGYRSTVARSTVVSNLPKTDKPRTKIITFAQPIISTYSEYVMIPVGQSLVSPELVDEYKGDFGVQYEPYYLGSYETNYNNILFVKKDGSDSHLLLNKKAAITQFYYSRQATSGKNEEPVDFLLFGIVEKDYNRDGELTSKDAVTAYIADLSGKNLVPVTPQGTRLLSFDIDKSRKIIYVTYQEDNDKNFRFNALDQTYLVEVDALTKKSKATIIDKNLTEKIKSIVY